MSNYPPGVTGNEYEIAGGFINNAVQFAWLNARKNNSKIIIPLMNTHMIFSLN